ncbi:YegP family protein [Brenneria sp. 4F2]|nr:YegP family protein [Brenneria bubanii]
MGYYEIKKSATAATQKYYWVLKAGNHEVIATSEMYSSKQAAKSGISSVQNNGPTTDVRDNTGEH